MDNKTLQLIAGILLIVVGLIVIFNPTFSIFLILGIIGAAMLLYGIIKLVTANRSGDALRMESLVLAILGIVLGTILLFSSFFKTLMLTVISVALGIVLLVRGIIGIIVAFKSRNYYDKWWISLIVRIVYIVLGILLFVFPLGLGQLSAILLGIGLVVFGADQITQRFMGS